MVKFFKKKSGTQSQKDFLYNPVPLAWQDDYNAWDTEKKKEESECSSVARADSYCPACGSSLHLRRKDGPDRASVRQRDRQRSNGLFGCGKPDASGGKCTERQK